MNLYLDYLAEIKSRETLGLAPKPIDDGALTAEIIELIEDTSSEYRADALKFFIYNTLPGTTSAAGVKAAFLKQIILGEVLVPEITPSFALELLSHMKGGPSIKVLLDVALGNDAAIDAKAGEVLKTQVFLYDADMFRLRDAYKEGSAIARDVLESYAKAEFFTKLPARDRERTYGRDEAKTFLAEPERERKMRSNNAAVCGRHGSMCAAPSHPLKAGAYDLPPERPVGNIVLFANVASIASAGRGRLK